MCLEGTYPGAAEVTSWLAGYTRGQQGSGGASSTAGSAVYSYTLQGNTVRSIARMLSGSADALMAINGVTAAVVLEPGMMLGIPAPGQ